MRIAVVAGELSGDLLGAGLIRALKRRYPDAHFEGIGGPGMASQGFDSLYPLETLSVMGLTEVLAHLPRLLKLRRSLIERWKAEPPDVFIGIDAPDFNLGLEEQLRQAGIKTVHYVSPTVWAWRQGRIRKIKRAVDLMLTVFPFEADFYRQHDVPVRFVGHTAADRFPLEHDVERARGKLAIEGNDPVIAILPGSRVSEVSRLGPVFAEAASRLAERFPAARFIAPMATEQVGTLFAKQLAQLNLTDRVRCLKGRSELAMGAADVVLSASGTATLEAMLLKRPTVVGYIVSPVSYWLFRMMIKVDRIAMPNLLAGEELMPEFIQGRATPVALAEAVAALLNNPDNAAARRARCLEIHKELRQQADEAAAEAIAECLL
ncbi:lipid-A-disaccharide synthase [Alkalilimnicola ehrlichii]|uniref:Lipid-A-disaccharide synthase n=1 Tax=Alkalilimnicola ehrlichii TaxID=351052 RepID=A0A3E0WPF3_9GAMM|nr:lipid-A-disaccharide synthase [Alkalilimnicola ehrlichii]RFA28253.1 lipid-A-disaccharide synthase [Alkalilimnicola ehrlichii]RFA34854.1 lipid-A-disaccharide synthase [Alkalilimnicola ehrlichii]